MRHLFDGCKTCIGLVALIAVLIVPDGARAGRQSPAAWRDRSPHRSRLVQAHGVRLHYLDWGGKGETLLFLHGIGSNAHDFDDFAPRFTDRFHVLALTRRGCGESEKPADGYDLATLAADIRGFMDALHLRRIHLVGHSLAGLEVTEVAARYPDRLLSVTYLEPTFDGPRVSSLGEQYRVPTPEPPTEAERNSLDAYLGWMRRYQGSWSPAVEASYRSSLMEGAFGVESVTPEEVTSQFYELLRRARQDYGRVKTRALYVYAVPTVEQRWPYLRGHADGLAKAAAYHRAHMALRRADVERFRAGGGDRQVVEMPETVHNLFIQRPAEAERILRAFLLGAKKAGS